MASCSGEAPGPGRDPRRGLEGCQRILVLGRTGSGKTTLARALSVLLRVQHVELDALYFGHGFATVGLPVLRARTTSAVAGERWVIDGNKRALRDIVWPRADTVVWLDYPLVVCLWRLGKRALWRTSVLKEQASGARAGSTGLLRQVLMGARSVLRALLSHRGQRRTYLEVFAQPQNRHLAVVRLRSPRHTRQWLAQMSSARGTSGRDPRQ